MGAAVLRLLLVAACASAVLHAASAAYAFGPIKPRGTDGIAEGFPLWVQDDAGNVCSGCLHVDPTGAGPCLSTRETQGMPDEFFYFAVMATITTPGGEVSYENAVEAAYGNGPVVAGDEMIFQRTRVRIDCPAADPPAGKPYAFVITTPYGEVVRETATLGGKRCVSFTSDIGAVTGNFEASLSGPITSFLKANPAPARRPGFPPQLGDFPNEVGAEFPDGTPAVLRVSSPATATTTSAFDGELTTQIFQTSCQVFDGSLLTLLDVQVSVNASDNSGSVEVWAKAGPNERPVATVEGVSRPLIKNTVPAADPPVPASLTINKPAMYFTSIPLPARPASRPWVLDLTVKSGSSVERRTVRPQVKGTAMFSGNVLTIKAATPDPTQPFTLALRFDNGSYAPLPITPASAGASAAPPPAGAAAAAGAGAAGRRLQSEPLHQHRRLAQATPPQQPTATFTQSADGTLSTPAPPVAIWACLPASPPSIPDQTCTEIRTQRGDAFDPTSIDGTPLVAVLVLSHPLTAVSGDSLVLDASQSTPSEGECAGAWSQLDGPTVGPIPAGYVVTLTTPATASQATLRFQFALQNCSSNVENPTSDPVVIELSSGAPSDYDLLPVQSPAGSVYMLRPFLLAPTLRLSNPATGSSTPVTNATYTVTTKGCGKCEDGASNTCYDAATATVTCVPPSAGPVSFDIAAFLPGKPPGSPPVRTLSQSVNVDRDKLSASTIRLDASKFVRGRGGWDIRLRVTSDAQLAVATAQGAPADPPPVSIMAYLTPINCADGNSVDGVGEVCASKYWALLPAAGVPCDAAGVCEFLSNNVMPRVLGSRPLTIPDRRASMYLYIVSSSGGVQSVPVQIKT